MPQGYALRNKGGCPGPANSGGSTWDDFYTCCPPDTYNKPNQYNTICRQGVNQPTLTQCANTTWDLYAWNNPQDDEYEYFCCLTGLQGIYSKESSTYGFFGCLNETDVDSDTMGSLEIRVAGIVPTTTSSTSTSTTSTSSSTTATSTTATTSTNSSASTADAEKSQASATPDSNSPASASASGGGSHNTGAIVGGVVGGVCAAALIGILIWLLLRYRSRTAKANKSGTEVSEQPESGTLTRSALQPPRELPPTEPSELSGDAATAHDAATSPGTATSPEAAVSPAAAANHGQSFGFYELEAKRDNGTNV